MAGAQRIMQLTVKMRRPNDSVKWGFRISGGVDYSEQLKITKITPGSLAEQVGLMAGDFVTYIGDPPADATIWTHEQAQQALVRQGNEIIMTVQRGGDYAIRSPPPISAGAGGVQTIKSQSPVPAPISGPGPAPLHNYNQTPPSFVGGAPGGTVSSPNSYGAGAGGINHPSMARQPQEIMRLTVKMRAGQGMAIDWGFRTAGGDGGPLRIISVRPESMAEDVGLQAGDMIYSVGDPASVIYNLPYHQAVQMVSNQGNNLIMTVQRGGDSIIESSGFQKAASQPSQNMAAGAGGGSGGQPSVIKRTVRMERPNQNTPWGFQVFGGRDFGQALVISKVTPGSMAQQVGLDEGDMLCFIGENPRQSVTGWTHQQAQQALINQGNKLVMTVEKKTNQNW